MPKPKNSQNKITSEVKNKLQILLYDLIAYLDMKIIDTNKVLKYFK